METKLLWGVIKTESRGFWGLFFLHVFSTLSLYLRDFTEYYYPSEFSLELETSEHTEIHYVHFLTGVLKFSSQPWTPRQCLSIISLSEQRKALSTHTRWPCSTNSRVTRKLHHEAVKPWDPHRQNHLLELKTSSNDLSGPYIHTFF